MKNQKQPSQINVIYRDPKNITIAVLVLLVLIFGVMTFFKKDSLYKYKLEQLKKEYDKERALRDSLDTEIFKVNNELAALKVREKELSKEVARLDTEINTAKETANLYQKELDRTHVLLEETRKQIKQLKSNPPNRTGNKLLESLKLKTQ